jgi:hypothetical protein
MKNLILIVLIHLAAAPVFSQQRPDLRPDQSTTQIDSSLALGNTYIQHVSSMEYEKLADLFSGNISFKALLPSGYVTAEIPLEIVAYYDKWFVSDSNQKYEMLDSRVEMISDILHISYKINIVRGNTSYDVQQQLFCELQSGKIQKLSLLCSGPRKIMQL